MILCSVDEERCKYKFQSFSEEHCFKNILVIFFHTFLDKLEILCPSAFDAAFVANHDQLSMSLV